MASTDTRGGQAVLTLSHVAGMIDLVALPVWIGTLMQHYRYSAPEAGITVTAFLASVAVTSVLLARRFARLPRYIQAGTGFAMAMMAFAIAALQAVDAQGHPLMIVLHVIAGVGVGIALSMTHGQMGRSSNPHRAFAVANIALGMFSIAFLAGVPLLIAATGPRTLFTIIAVIMGIAALGTLRSFPTSASRSADSSSATAAPRGVSYLIVAAIVCLCLNQAMVFSFVERIGTARGFQMEQVNGVLIAIGLVNLIPGALAAFLQKSFSAVIVGMAGPLLQALLALVLTSSHTFAPYAMASSVYVAVVIFTHVFLFGLLSRIDTSGRMVAATPAMMMLGSCCGPAIGGWCVQALGYEGLGWVACVTSTCAITFIMVARLLLRPFTAISIPSIERTEP